LRSWCSCGLRSSKNKLHSPLVDISALIALASSLLALLTGLGFLIIYLRGTPPSASPRCRRCAYTLATQPLPKDAPLPRCPECGHLHTGHADLHRRHRSRGKLLIAVACISASPLFSVALWLDPPRLAKIIPTPALLRISPVENEGSTQFGAAFHDELRQRIIASPLSEKDLVLLVERCARESDMLDMAIGIRPVSWAGAPCSIRFGHLTNDLLDPFRLALRARLAFTDQGTPGRWIDESAISSATISGVPAEAEQVTIDYEILGTSGGVYGSRIVKQRRIAPSPDDCLEPLDVPLGICTASSPEMLFACGSRPILLFKTGLRSRDTKLVIGIVIEVLRGGKVVASGTHVAGGESPLAFGISHNEGMPVALSWNESPPPAFDSADDWSIRLTGSREIAACGFLAPTSASLWRVSLPTSYWRGTHEVKITEVLNFTR
jgi:hypothetical protein